MKMKLLFAISIFFFLAGAYLIYPSYQIWSVDFDRCMLGDMCFLQWQIYLMFILPVLFLITGYFVFKKANKLRKGHSKL